MERYTSREPMTFAKKIENFWYHHKLKVLSALLILCITLVGIHSCMNKQSVDMYVLYMVNGAYSTESNEALALKLEQYVDDLDDDGEKRVQIITVSFSDVLARTDQSQEATLARLVGQVASGPALFYVFDDANYKALKEAKVQIFDEIANDLPESEFVESDRYNASSAGFLDGVLGFEDADKPMYFSMRNSKEIPEEDNRYPQIKQCRDTLNRIVTAYN